MSSKFGLLLCLLIAVHIASASLSKRSRMLTTDYVTKSGEVTINKDSYGYYVNADLSYNYYDASDSEADDSSIAQMSLGLYTSQTVFSTDCLDFNDYYCSEYNCYEYTSESKTPSYLDFKVTTGYYASTNLYLDYGNWELQSGAVIAAYCDDNTYSSYGYERYGILGLGFNGTSSNFINNSMFSISLARDGSSGTLLFWSNSDMTSYDNYVGELTSTLDWQIAPSYIYVYVNSNYVTSTYSGLIFDLNTNGIAFPSNIYTSIIEDLEDAVSGMSCNIYNYQPYCYYYGRVGDLPTISIDVQGVQINLPPTLYVLDESDSDSYVDGIYLNFRLISPSYSGYNYVSSAYQNYIILDSSFMRYYYAEFSYNSGSPFISLYSQPSTPNNPSSNPSWPYIVGGVVGAIVIFSIICCCIKRRQVKLQQENTRRLITPYEAPQVTNVVIAAPAPAQTYPQYDQGGYGYGYYQQYQQAPNQTNAYGTYDNGNAYNYQQGQYYGN